MKIEALVLGKLQTNCYLVYDSSSKEGVVIDPADEAEFIAEKIERLKFKPQAILATHGHFDHFLAAGGLQLLLSKFEILNPKSQIKSKSKILNNLTMKQFNNCIPFYLHQNDLFLLKRMNQSASHWLGFSVNKPPPLNVKFLKEDDVVKFGRFALKVIETPGHTPGSICLLSTSLTGKPINSLTLFSGDTLFKNGFGRYDFAYSEKEKLYQSLKKLFNLPINTHVYPGHGQKTIIKAEKTSLIS